MAGASISLVGGDNHQGQQENRMYQQAVDKTAAPLKLYELKNLHSRAHLYERSLKFVHSKTYLFVSKINTAKDNTVA